MYQAKQNTALHSTLACVALTDMATRMTARSAPLSTFLICGQGKIVLAGWDLARDSHRSWARGGREKVEHNRVR